MAEKKLEEIRISDSSLLHGIGLVDAKLERLLREGYTAQRDEEKREWIFRKYV